MKKSLLLFILLLAVTFANAQLSGYYKQGFEDTAFPPPEWSTINNDNHNENQSEWRLAPYPHAHEGRQSAYSGNNRTEDYLKRDVNYLIMPQFKVTSGDSLVFWLRDYSSPQVLDTLSVMVSTTGTDSSNFTSTLANYINQPFYPVRDWQREAFDLSAFAGQNIFIAFRHINRADTNTGGYADTFIDDVALGTPPQKDIRILNLDIDTSLGSGMRIAPTATFQNVGSATQTFNVSVQSGSYISTKTITALPFLYTQQVTFDSITLPSSPGDITFMAYSSLAGDADAGNDTAYKYCHVLQTFANLGWITEKDFPLLNGVGENAVTSYHKGISPYDTAYLFSIGGILSSQFYKKKYLDVNYEFNVNTKTWKPLSPLPAKNSGGFAFTYNDKIYYFGGAGRDSDNAYNLLQRTNKVLIYDIATDKWSDGGSDSLYEDSYFTNVCQYHDSLFYVLGDFYYSDEDGTYEIYQLHVYNAATQKWSFCSNYPVELLDGLRMGIVKNTLVTAFEDNYPNSVKFNACYKGVIDPGNPTNVTWSLIPYYPGGNISNVGASNVNSTNDSLVYFTAGEKTDSVFDVVTSEYNTIASKATYAYNVVSDKWEKGPDKPTGVADLYEFTPFVLHDTLYFAVIGGSLNIPIDLNTSTNIVIDTTANEWLVIGPATSTVLAEHLISFTATWQNDKTALNWKVSEDGSGGYYIIQRAADAVHFADISLRTNAGKASGVKSYTGYDELPLKGYNYYRIKTVSADGSVSYSAIKAVNNISLSSITASIYPNPTHGLLNVVLQHNNGSDAIISIAISDITGRKIINESIIVNGSLNLFYNLKTGTYVINLLSKDGTFKQSRKVVVE